MEIDMKYSRFSNPIKNSLRVLLLLALLLFSFGISGVHRVQAVGEPPATDLFENAEPITTLPYNPGGTAIDTTGASREGTIEPNPGDFPGDCEGKNLKAGRNTVWYEYSPGGTTTPVYLDTSGSTTSEIKEVPYCTPGVNCGEPFEYDTYIAVFVRNNDALPVAITNLHMVACTDNPNNDTNQAQLAFTAEASKTYYISVAQYDGTIGDAGSYPGYEGGALVFKMNTALTISGNAGIGGAVLSYKGGAATADSSGNYSLAVPSGFTNTITASHPLGAVFTPANKVYNNVTSSLVGQNYTGKRTFPSISKWTPNFDLAHGWTVNLTVRTVGDVNGDGKVDLVGFGVDGVYVGLALTRSGFGTPTKWTSSFDMSHGWTVSDYVRTVGDVNGDGRADLVGFGLDGVYVALALNPGPGFGPISKWTSSFDLSHGWTVSQYVRTVSDVNGDGRADLVGFGLDGVYVALALNPGPGFGPISKWTSSLAAANGWNVSQYVRTVGDVNGDGRADLVGFGLDGVFVALALNPGPGFGPVSKWTSSFDLSHGWTVSQYVRTVGDLNGDNKADLVGFGADGVYVALSNGTNAFNAISRWTSSFDLSHGWTVASYVRTVGDANGDGLDDLIGFGLDGVYVAP